MKNKSINIILIDINEKCTELGVNINYSLKFVF